MRRIALILALMLLPLVVSGQHHAGCIPTMKEHPFKGGEKINFSMTYKWGAVNTEVASGLVTLDSLVYNGQPAYHMNFKVKSAAFFDVFFKMREDFHSWFTAKDLRPLKFTRDTYEGGYTAKNTYIYDWPAKVIHADVDFSSRGQRNLDIPLQACTYDLPSLIFYLRSMDISRIKPGSKYNLSFAIDDEVYDIRLTYHGPEQLKVRRKGKMDAYLFTCSVVSGALFEGNQELKFWFSADGKYVPLGVMAPLRVGAVWVWLKDYQP